MRAATSTLAAFANGFLTVFCEVMPSRPRIAPRVRPPNAPVPPEKRVSTQTPNKSGAAGSPPSPAECLEEGKRRGLVSRAGARRSSNMGGGFFGVNLLTGVQEMHGGTVQSDSTQGYTWAHTGYTGVHRGTQGYTRVHRGTQHISYTYTGYSGWSTYETGVLMRLFDPF